MVLRRIETPLYRLGLVSGFSLVLKRLSARQSLIIRLPLLLPRESDVDAQELRFRPRQPPDIVTCLPRHWLVYGASVPYPPPWVPPTN